MKIQILPEEPPAAPPPRRTWRGFFQWMVLSLVIGVAMNGVLDAATGRVFSWAVAMSGGMGMGIWSYVFFKVM